MSTEQSKKPMNAIFESFERQLNSRLAIVNSSLVNQKTAENTEQAGTLKKSFEELSETINKSRSDATERRINSGRADRDLSTKIPVEPSLKNSVHNSRIARIINSTRLESQLKNLTPDNKTENSGSKKPDIDQLLGAYTNQDKPQSITNGKSPVMGAENQGQGFKEGLASVESKAESRNFVRETITNTGPNQPQSSQFESVIKKFSDALGMRLISAVQQNQWNLQLKLNPASLGEINVTLDFNEGNLEGKLYATDETTRALLQESLSRLKFGLKENLDNYQAIDVFIGDKKDHPDNQNKTPKSGNEAQEIDLSEEIASKTHLARTISSGRIDIQV
jgi:flagellar hook-length control protein FliK